MNDQLVTPRAEAVAAEALASAAVLRALRRGRPGGRPEEMLLDLGLVSDQHLALELALAAKRPFCGLRGFAPDSRLFLYLPLYVALRERLCPLVIVGDSLKLATAFIDPDLSYLTERFPKLELELCVSPRDEILTALGHIAPST